MGRFAVVKNIPNAMTLSRIFFAFALLCTKPMSLVFYTLYGLCGLTDVLDGFVARKHNVVSYVGAILDSVADLIFVGIVLFMFWPLLKLERGHVLWIIVIAVVRGGSLAIGYVKYKGYSALHTYANKVTGVLLFTFPWLYPVFGTANTYTFLCSVASISAIEEMAIQITSKGLSRDVKSLFVK